ncbi:MAG: penicillin-binding protein 2 [Nitriliruptorales bacterium]|nr:penicillin-binding protein 2 [Nitriliruptorales bacterium]
MTGQIRRTAVFVLILFGALFVNLNVIQLVRADDLANHPSNRRLIIKEYESKRGPIVAGESAIAFSEATDDVLKYLRIYEDPKLWAHVTGYYSFVLGRSGVEAAMNEALTGTSTEVLAQNLAELVGQRDEVGDTVQLTIDPRIQGTARQALGDRVGAVVALDPRSGAVLAHYSNPSFDPNRLSSHDASAIVSAWRELQNADRDPLLNRVTRALYPPGSTFKLITAAAALEEGISPETAFPDQERFDVPQTDNDIGNYGGGVCAGGETISLEDALRVSCNTVFARLGVQLGGDALIATAERFGFNRVPPYELTPVKSQIPKELNEPQAAQSAIGQFDVRATPLQMALVVQAIVNDGQLLRPHVVGEVLDPSGRTVRGPDRGVWSEGRFDGQVVSAQTAQILRELMIEVVADGTGRAAQIADHTVGGKTGTAQDPANDSATVWFVGFADDEVVVAVVLPDAGAGATGGGDAAPIARAVMEAALGLR